MNPIRIDLELSAKCNISCVMCHQSQVRLKSMITIEDLRRLAPTLKKGTEISLHGNGEPLMSPVIREALELLKGQSVYFHSNGTLWSEANRQLLLQYSPDPIKWINLSLDAATPETHKKIRGVNLNKVLENARALIAERKQLGKEHPRICANMTCMKENFHELPELVKLSTTLDNWVMFWPLNDDQIYGGENWVVKRDEFEFVYKDQVTRKWEAEYQKFIELGRQEAEKLGVKFDISLDRQGKEPEPSECPVVDNILTIWSNGDVRHCCHQKYPVFNWKKYDGQLLTSHPRLAEVSKALKDNKIPRECSEARCDWVRKRKSPEDVRASEWKGIHSFFHNEEV